MKNRFLFSILGVLFFNLIYAQTNTFPNTGNVGIGTQSPIWPLTVNGLELSKDQYKEIAYKVLCSDPTLLKSDDTVIVDGVNNWVPAMLLTPLYSEIPIKYRGKVMELQQMG